MTDYILLYIGKHEYKFINIESVSDLLKEKIGESYSSEVGIAVREALTSHDGIDFFREGNYYLDQKCYYCVGNWLAVKDVYVNPVQAKFKMKWYAWQDTEEIDWTLG